MYKLGLCPENFNPQILYVFKSINTVATNTKYHCHDFLELSYILSGKGSYSINDKLYDVEAGDLLAFNPNVYHRQYSFGEEKFEEIHIGIKNFHFNNLPKDYIIDEHFSGVIRFTKTGEYFLKCCNEILEEQKNNELGYDLVLKSLIMKLMILLLREVSDFSDESKNECCTFDSSEKSNIIHTIISFMNDNYMYDISLDRISKNMYLSPIYISKIFKEETGDSPIKYLIKIRLQKASHLLRKNKEISIKEISKLVGYKDAYYFSKLFKKYYGCSPLKFKLKYAEK